MKTFNQYLDSLPIEEARALRLAELAWLRSRRPAASDQGRNNPVERDFQESMRGFSVPPAGSSAAGGFSHVTMRDSFRVDNG